MWSFGTTWLTPRIQEFMKLNPEIEIELIFDDRELDLSTRQADIGIWMRRPKQLNYIQKKLIDIHYHIYGSTKIFRTVWSSKKCIRTKQTQVYFLW